MAETPPSSPPLPSELLQAIEAFKNRKRYTTLDKQTIEALGDSELEQAVLDVLHAKLFAPGAQKRLVLQGFTPEQRSFFLSWEVEAEVLNGGFNQYFSNSSGENAPTTPDALAAIGSPAAAELMRKALAIASAEASKMAQLRRAGTPQAFSDSYKVTELNTLDGSFAKLAAGFSSLRLRYVRANPLAFEVRK